MTARQRSLTYGKCALPSAIVNPTGKLEQSSSVSKDLARARGSKSKFATENVGKPSNLPVLGTAPDFVGNQRWFNTANGKPLTLKELRGKVVLVDFWTYTCINWLRTVPYVRAWAEKYKNQGLVVIGVHTPEFAFERDVDNVRRAAKDMRVDYPIAIDSDSAVWNAFKNEYWPALYFVDAQGRVRHHQFGEGGYDQSERVIQQLLADVDSLILPGVTHWQSPKFHAYFPANASGPAILGDLLSSALGVQGMLWATSPACTEATLFASIQPRNTPMIHHAISPMTVPTG